MKRKVNVPFMIGVSLVVVVVLSIALVFGAMMHGGGIGMKAAASDEISVLLNGTKVEFDQPPILQNGRTLVPMRAIFEALGYEVYWDEYYEQIDVYDGDEDIMTLWIGVRAILMPPRTIEIDVPPMLVNDRTLVPVRAISEGLGAEVDWNDYSQTVIITYQPQQSSSPATNPNDTQQDICHHETTKESAWADSIKMEDIGSPDAHNYSYIVITRCAECGEELSQRVVEKLQAHSFEGNRCKWCGYEKTGSASADDNRQGDPPARPEKPPVQNIDVNAGNLNIDDDGNYKTLHLRSGESFMATNRSEKSIKILVEKGDYVKNFHYVIYKPDGNVETTHYDRSISTYGNREIKAGYSIGIYNPNEYDIDIKAPSDVFYPEAKPAFEITRIPLNQGVEIENDGQTTFGVRVYGNQYDAKSFDYVIYKADGNVEATYYDRSISTYGNREIKAGYILGIYNTDNKNNDSIMVMKPMEQGLLSQSSVFDITTLGVGESCRIDNNTKTAFSVRVRSNTGAKKFDYTDYDANGTAGATQYNRSISTYGTRTVKPNCSVTISNSSDETIEVYVPEYVAN